MGYTQRFRNAPKPAALDVHGLLLLIQDPKKAEELWNKYQEAHAAYEAELAEIKRMTAEIEKAHKILWQDNFDLEEEQKKFDEQIKNKTEQLRKWEQDLEQSKKSNDLTAMGLSDKYKSLQDWQYKLDYREEAVQHQADLNVQHLGREEKRLQDLEEILLKREAAIAERESKAEKLAQILKDI